MDKHISVMLQESVNALNLEPRGVAIDATTGQGGHAQLMAEKVGEHGTVIAIDADQTSLDAAQEVLSGIPAHFIFVHGNFRNLAEHAARVGVSSADGILFDLGWHSGQLMSGRGFSFREDAPLLMTLNAKPEPYQVTAADIIANWNEDDLVTLFRENGERFAGRIARVIVEERVHNPIKTSKQLADIVTSAVPKSWQKRRIHPATKVFQALRIAVNDEFGALHDGLDAAIDLLAPQGRLAVISFHSAEDKIVKETLKAAVKAGRGALVVKKPQTPSRTEAVANPRSRSAKLRVFEKYV